MESRCRAGGVDVLGIRTAGVGAAVHKRIKERVLALLERKTRALVRLVVAWETADIGCLGLGAGGFCGYCIAKLRRGIDAECRRRMVARGGGGFGDVYIAVGGGGQGVFVDESEGVEFCHTVGDNVVVLGLDGGRVCVYVAAGRRRRRKEKGRRRRRGKKILTQPWHEWRRRRRRVDGPRVGGGGGGG